MPFYDLKCESCEHIQIDVLCKVSEHPPCENCNGPTTRIWISRKAQAIVDDIPGGVWLENYGPHPVKVYSHTERKRLMKQVRRDPVTGQEYQLSQFVRHVPLPGTDKSPHTTDWSRAVDAQTLANAKALLERVGHTPTSREVEGSEGDPTYRVEGLHPFNRTGTLPVSSQVKE